MKKYIFTNTTSAQEHVECISMSIGILVLIYGFTTSIALCNAAVLLGSTAALKHFTNASYTFNKLIKNNLRKLIKNNEFYHEEEKKLVYYPELYYSYNEKTLYIKIRLDGSKYRDKYIELENSLQDLFLMECISKEQNNGYMVYKLERLSTGRLNIADIRRLDSDFIPINSKMSWNFRKCPHALIAGVTGKGKTYLLAYLIKMFMLIKADIKILDPKMSDLSYLERIINNSVFSIPEQIAKTLREVKEKMNERYELFKNLSCYAFGKDYKDYGFTPILIIFDEVAAFMASVDKKLAKEIDDYLAEIILKGRQAGVFMILTTQRPDADVIKTAIRDQLGLRVTLGQMSKTGYSMVFGSEFNDLELNNNVPGNGYIFIDGLHTKPVKFQSPLFNQDYNFVKDLNKIIRRG